MVSSVRGDDNITEINNKEVSEFVGCKSDVTINCAYPEIESVGPPLDDGEDPGASGG